MPIDIYAASETMQNGLLPVNISQAELISGFITLVVLEIVLGIDNLIFIALIVEGLSRKVAQKVRMIGLSLALIIRVMMLFTVRWIMSFQNELWNLYGYSLLLKDLLMFGGGIFLVIKSTTEIHQAVVVSPKISDTKSSANGQAANHKGIKTARTASIGIILQVVLIDFLFSFDSIITAVALTPAIWLIVAAVTISMVVMMIASAPLARFLQLYKGFKVIALCFILMIGIVLMAEGLHFHIPRGYIYAAFALAVLAELVNNLARRYKAKRGVEKAARR